MRIWVIPDSQASQVLEGHTGYVTGCAFSDNSDVLVTTARDLSVRIWAKAGGGNYQLRAAWSEAHRVRAALEGGGARRVDVAGWPDR